MEVSFGGLIDGNRDFKLSDEEMSALMHKAKKAVDDAGIKVWSIHMPFGRHIDLSLTDEAERQGLSLCTGNCSHTAKYCSLKSFSSTRVITWA